MIVSTCRFCIQFASVFMLLRVGTKASKESPASSGIISAPCGAIQAKTTPIVIFLALLILLCLHILVLSYNIKLTLNEHPILILCEKLEVSENSRITELRRCCCVPVVRVSPDCLRSASDVAVVSSQYSKNVSKRKGEENK
jgi:hypothetical protein